MDSNNDWYEALLSDCKSIVTEYGFTSRFSKIEGYYELGKRVLEENSNFDRTQIYGEKIVKRVSESLQMSERTLQYAVQFAQKFPDLNMAPIDESFTWTRVIRELLPENPTPVEKKLHKCPRCNFEFS